MTKSTVQSPFMRADPDEGANTLQTTDSLPKTQLPWPSDAASSPPSENETRELLDLMLTFIERSDLPQGDAGERMCALFKKHKVLLQNLPDSAQQKRERTFLSLYEEPPSPDLQALFRKAEDEHRDLDNDSSIEAALIEHMKCFANLCGPERAKYHSNPLKGLHYPNPFVDLWNQMHPELPFTFADRDIRFTCCPPSWTSEVKHNHWVLRYTGVDFWGRGLNELVDGPTTLDCGMWCSVALLWGLRAVVGVKILRQRAQFAPGEFILTQYWDEPMNSTGTKGNLLYRFYNYWPSLPVRTISSIMQTSIVYNHNAYLQKHPGGAGRLYNTIQIGDEYLIFDSTTHRSIVSLPELERLLRQDYNAPWDSGDWNELWSNFLAPEQDHPNYPGKKRERVFWEAIKKENHTLSETDWASDRPARPRAMQFDFFRLIDGLKASEDGANFKDVSLREKFKYEDRRFSPL
ncbi:hypothetical protein GGI35DRAFT_465215 [Trichoderma velutinum]